jgi:hypothetical protein
VQRLATVLVSSVLALTIGWAVTLAGMGGVPAFTADASSADAGDRMELRARVGRPDREASFSASAVVHFASGDEAVNLERLRDRFAARVRLTVPDCEAPGPVTVDVTIVNGDTSAVITFMTEVTGELDEDCGEDPPPPEI